MIKRMLLGVVALGCAMGMSPLGASADATGPVIKKVMPDAMDALVKMGEYLLTLKEFTLSAKGTTEDVLDYGEKITIGAELTYRVKVPNRLQLDTKTDKRARQFFYNGKTLTVYSPSKKFYAVAPAPDTIPKMLNEVEDKLDIEVPLADLFYLGTKGSAIDSKNVLSAFYVSDAEIDGSVCAHYSYRTRLVNYQIWIHKNGEPLPCKVVRDLVRDPARPQYSAVLTWKTDEKFSEDMFNFVPAAGDELIKMRGAKPVATAQ
jgi:hypothetical protein